MATGSRVERIYPSFGLLRSRALPSIATLEDARLVPSCHLTHTH